MEARMASLPTYESGQSTLLTWDGEKINPNIVDFENWISNNLELKLRSMNDLSLNSLAYKVNKFPHV